MQKIIAVNSGSSSLKFQLVAMPQEIVLVKGLFEQIGTSQANFIVEINGHKNSTPLTLATHQETVDYLLNFLIEQKIIDSLAEIEAVGHRVVHGGEKFKQAMLIDETVSNTIEQLIFLAPSHNPINLVGIRAFQKALPNTKQVAVFDTAFHQTLTPEFYTYPLPQIYKEKYQLRKYGFHGISHHYIADTVHHLFKSEGEQTTDLKIISCHLGNGASICAIKNGKSVNTSMGFTPLAGLMMGSRSGDIDPAIVPFLMEQEQLTPHEISDILNKQSGLLAISNISNDIRDIEKALDQGNQQAELALQLFINRVAQTIASYMVDLSGADIIVFTAGIGEHAKNIRARIVEKLNVFHIYLNDSANEQGQLYIHAENSKVRLAIIPTNEEIMIARETMNVVFNR